MRTSGRNAALSLAPTALSDLVTAPRSRFELAARLNTSLQTADRVVRRLREIGVEIATVRVKPGEWLYVVPQATRDYLDNLKTLTVGDLDERALVAALEFFAEKEIA